MKTKTIYGGILSIMLLMSFFSDARRARHFETQYQYREALQKLRTLPEASRAYRELQEAVREFQTDYPELSRRWTPSESKTENDVLNREGEGEFSLRDGVTIRLNEVTGVSAREKAETIEVLAEFTSLSRPQILEVLNSRNTEAVDQLRQLAIHVKNNRESVNPETINSLVELAYTMRNREREASAQQNYTPSVNVMLSLVRNIASMATTWAATPRANALKLIVAFNQQYKTLKARSGNAGKSLVASALNAALKVAEGIHNLRERNARKREIDVLCRQ